MILSAVAPARGDLVNGDFSQGLTGWTVTPAGQVTVVAGQAVIQESPDPNISEVDGERHDSWWYG